jgi:hypothetical protein
VFPAGNTSLVFETVETNGCVIVPHPANAPIEQVMTILHKTEFMAMVLRGIILTAFRLVGMKV